AYHQEAGIMTTLSYLAYRQGDPLAGPKVRRRKGTQMNRKKLVMTAAAAAVLLGLSACTSDETDTASETTTAVETTATSGSSTTEQAEESAQHSEADVMFAQMMIPHHEQAIEMSDIILS